MSSDPLIVAVIAETRFALSRAMFDSCGPGAGAHRHLVMGAADAWLARHTLPSRENWTATLAAAVLSATSERELDAEELAVLACLCELEQIARFRLGEAVRRHLGFTVARTLLAQQSQPSLETRTGVLREIVRTRYVVHTVDVVDRVLEAA